MACGGAPLSPDTHEFIRICLDVKMLQAYGMTETAASATIMTRKLPINVSFEQLKPIVAESLYNLNYLLESTVSS